MKLPTLVSVLGGFSTFTLDGLGGGADSVPAKISPVPIVGSRRKERGKAKQ